MNRKPYRLRQNVEFKLKLRYLRRHGFSALEAYKLALLISGIKKVTLIVSMAVFFSGCHGLDRLINGPESPEIPDSPVIVGDGGNTLSPEPPNFNLPIPDNTTLVKYHGLLPSGNTIQLSGNTHSIRGFIKEGGQVNQWFQIPGFVPSSGYYYQYNAQNNTVTFYGQWINNKEYCIYQYVPTL